MDKETKEGAERMAELVVFYKEYLEENGVSGELLINLVVSYQDSLFKLMALGQQAENAKRMMMNNKDLGLDNIPGGVN
jgi:hypothetical protein